MNPPDNTNVTRLRDELTRCFQTFAKQTLFSPVAAASPYPRYSCTQDPATDSRKTRAKSFESLYLIVQPPFSMTSSSQQAQKIARLAVSSSSSSSSSTSTDKPTEDSIYPNRRVMKTGRTHFLCHHQERSQGTESMLKPSVMMW